jgi:cytochrome c peroxidase
MTQSARIRKPIKTQPNSIERRLSATNSSTGGSSARRVFVSLIALLWLGTTLAALVSAATPESTPHSDSAFSLSDTCPASFELKDGGCILRNRYRAYRSLRDSGVGGLKTGLPPLREGFTPQQIDLGRYLFFDPILSADGSISCASCHDPALGFSDGRGQAVGIKGQFLPRSAPSLWNVGFLSTLLWDGSKASLEEQMQGPLYSNVEMGNSPAQLLATLSTHATYPSLFERAFGSSPLSLDQIYTAIAAFESSLISLNSRYDLYAHGYQAALNEDEIAGLNVFRSFVARCAECHTPPLFTNQQLAVLGVADAPGQLIDPGAEAITGDASQRGAFRVPSLRNVARTAPYMHRGQKATLAEAARFYTGGRGHEMPETESLMIHWHIWEPKLTDAEIALLETFMTTLTDEAFMPEIPAAVPSGLPVTGARAPVGTSTGTMMHNDRKARLTITTGRNNNSGATRHEPHVSDH